jgi:hypothetical protein
MLKHLAYQDFKPITIQEFLDCFQESYQLSKDETLEQYMDWLKDFHRRAALFYQAVCLGIQLTTERAFKHEYDIHEDDSIPYWVDDEWKYYWNTKAYDIHDMYTTLWEHHSSARTDLSEKIDTNESPSANFQRYLKRRGPLSKEIDELWFNTSINTPHHIQAELRKLPYNDYLKTPHWQRVREAMLLIGVAKCRELSCSYCDESWYGEGGESELDVHHLTYKNLGNERYQDLVLLCRKHHEQWHQSKKLLGTPNIEIT